MDVSSAWSYAGQTYHKICVCVCVRVCERERERERERVPVDALDRGLLNERDREQREKERDRDRGGKHDTDFVQKSALTFSLSFSCLVPKVVPNRVFNQLTLCRAIHALTDGPSLMGRAQRAESRESRERESLI